MYQTTHEKFFLLIDEMVEKGILVPSVHGYRLSKNIFNSFRKNPFAVKQKINDDFIDYTAEFKNNNNPIANRIEDNRNRIEYRLVRECRKSSGETVYKSLKPGLSGNLAVDIVTIIAFNLMGERFYRDKKGKLRKNVDLPSWISLTDIIKNLSESWVFLD